MTEAEWLNNTDPPSMVRFLQHRDQFSERKGRLFAVVCCRRINPLPDDETEAALELAEQFADGRANSSLLAEVRATVERLYRLVSAAEYIAVYYACCDYDAGDADASHNATDATRLSANFARLAVIGGADRNSDLQARRSGNETRNAAEEAEMRAQACLLRDIFGNPFRPTSFDPAWLQWNDGAVRKMAQAIYDDRAFDRMPILADALEEAGCTEQSILDHCRSGGEHVRGCWVVDLLLGKE